MFEKFHDIFLIFQFENEKLFSLEKKDENTCLDKNASQFQINKNLHIWSPQKLHNRNFAKSQSLILMKIPCFE